MTSKFKQALLGAAGILASLLFVATTVAGVQSYGAPGQPTNARHA